VAGKKTHGLTDGQKECLRLVDQLFTSKEIARKLGISPFTVDQRLDTARIKLNAANRKEAAKIFASMDAANMPDPFVYDVQTVAYPDDFAKLAGSKQGNGDLTEKRHQATLQPIFADQQNFAIHNHSLTARFQSFRNQVPPIGGYDNNITRTDVLTGILKTALLGILGVFALTIVSVVIMRILG
jgi:DNA-binding CsgD family transcriptional regulator